MKNCFLALCALALLLPSSLHAQDIAATWQGTFNDGIEPHRAVVQIAKANRGWSANTFDIEFFHDPLHIDSVTLRGANLKLTVDGGKGVYEGKLSKDGASITGAWTYDHHAAPLTLRRATKETAWPTPFLYQYHYRDITIPRPLPDEPKIPFSPQLAEAYIEQGAVAWTGDWKCVACHTNGSYMVARPLMTEQLGSPNPALRDFFVSQLRDELATDPAKLNPAEDSTQAVYIAAGLAIWDAHVTHHLSPETAEALDMMFKLQRSTGDWTISDDNNPPLESSTYQLATVAARAVGNAPGWLAAQQDSPVATKVKLLEDFLRNGHKMQADYDRTDLLWASAELPGLIDAARQQQLIAMILQHQRPDGGWAMRSFAQPEQWGKGNRAPRLRAEPDLADPPSDGHMTGLAIIALRKAGVPATDPHIQRGIAWLTANQRSSGRWWTRSLNTDNWKFINYSGTVYPLLALSMCDALPVTH